MLKFKLEGKFFKHSQKLFFLLWCGPGGGQGQVHCNSFAIWNEGLEV